MRRPLVVILSVVILELVLTPAPVSAVGGAESPNTRAIDGLQLLTRRVPGVWDPDDVEGRLDIRWIGAVYTATGDIHLSLSFYDGFERRFLPRSSSGDRSYVYVSLTGAWGGSFERRRGRIVFVWGDGGSVCCERARVRRPSPNVLSVVFDPCSYAYWSEIDQAQGESYWHPRKTRATDRTRVVHLAQPDCDA